MQLGSKYGLQVSEGSCKPIMGINEVRCLRTRWSLQNVIKSHQKENDDVLIKLYGLSKQALEIPQNLVWLQVKWLQSGFLALAYAGAD